MLRAGCFSRVSPPRPECFNCFSQPAAAEGIEAHSGAPRHRPETPRVEKGGIETLTRNTEMKAINDLYEALRKRREERRAYFAVRHLPLSLRRDIGLMVDDVSARARRA